MNSIRFDHSSPSLPYSLLIILLILVIAFNSRCNLIQPEGSKSPDYDSGFYYLTSRGKVDLFRSRTIIAVIFDSNITSEKAKSIVQKYNLEPIKMFDTTAYEEDWDKLIKEDIILMKLPKGAKLEDYVSTFPRRTNQKFGDIKEVRFCLPVFAFDSSGDPRSRFIINDELIVSSKTDSANTLKILQPYNLILVKKNEWSEYTFKISHNSPANSLSISNLLYNHDEFNWSNPNGYACINLWGLP